MKALLLALIFALCIPSCSLRGKQIAGASFALSTLPVNMAIDGSSQSTQIVRASATFALLAAAVTLFEMDARRTRTGERVALIYNSLRRPLVGDYVEEWCDKDHVLVCSGPYQTYLIQAVRRLKDGATRAGARVPRYALTTTIVDKLPADTDRAAIHPLIVRGPMAASAWDDAEPESSCALGCADSGNLDLQNEN